MSIKKGLLCAAVCVSAFLLCGFKRAEQYAAGDGYIKAATYMSDEWAINFWSLEFDNIDQELKQIREDGFNHIVIVVPWRQFQPTASVGSVNEEAYKKLKMILEQAAAQDLGVILRLGYQWDYYTEGNVLTRYYMLLHDQNTRNAWMDYTSRIYETVSQYPNYSGAFLTWEDFWSFLTQYGTGEGTRSDAAKSGYAAYAAEHYSMAELSALYGENIRTVSDLYYPDSDQPARKVMYEFYDVFLNQLLAETQQVFPGLSMEVRLDMDPVPGLSGDLVGVAHNITFPCGSAAYSSCMLSANMGYGAGEQLSASQALLASTEILQNLVRGGGKRTFVDQFLYMDNTPEFSYNAKLSDSQEVSAYIRAMAAPLQTYSCGYAVWTYRDYADNMVENPQFGEGLKSWKTKGKVTVEEKNGTNMIHLNTGGQIQQNSMYRGFLSSGTANVSMVVVPQLPSQIRITAGTVSDTFWVEEAGMLQWKNISGADESKFSVECVQGDIYLDDIKYYSHITEGGIHQIDGTPGVHKEDILALNNMLPD